MADNVDAMHRVLGVSILRGVELFSGVLLPHSRPSLLDEQRAITFAFRERKRLTAKDSSLRKLAMNQCV